MSVLAIKSWRAETKPFDNKGTHIHITGRKSGIIDFLLALMKIDPVTKVIVSSERLEFSQASLSGTEYRVIPLQNICSTYFGYSKPWKMAIGMWIGLLFLAYSLTRAFASEGEAVEGLILLAWIMLLGAVLSLVYYVINIRITLGFVESSGHVSVIAFKRSVIENVQINDEQARNACIIVQRCIEAKLNRSK